MRSSSLFFLFAPSLFASPPQLASPETINFILETTFPLATAGSTHLFNEEEVYFPDEIWINILKNLDGPTLWNMSLTDKHLGSLLRGPAGFQSILSEDSCELLNLLESSELKIYSHHLDLFKNAASYHRDLYTYPRNQKSIWVGTRTEALRGIFTDINNSTARLQERAGDWETFHYFLTGFSGTSFMDERTLGPAIIEDMWACDTEVHSREGRRMVQQMFYLPEPSAQKLFDRIDPKTVFRHTFSIGNSSNYIFLPLLLSDYLLPCFRGELQVTHDEKECLGLIFKHQSKWFTHYFARLFWALNFSDGYIEGSQKKEKICEFLKDFGFDMKVIKPDNYFFNFRSLNTGKLKLIFAVATQWGLDIEDLRDPRVSYANINPSELADFRKFTGTDANNMHYLMRHNPEKDLLKTRKMHLVDGELVSDLKRKRDNEDDADDGGNKRSKMNLRRARDGS